MRLYLVQHGKAMPKDANPDRPLTEEGRRDVEKVARLLQSSSLRVEAIYHSGKTRAAQTAEILGRAVTSEKGVVSKDGLAPNDPVAPIREELESAGKDAMIVGHLPFVGKLASAVIAGNEDAEAVLFSQGGIVCIEKPEGRNGAVAWMLIPDLLA